MNWAIGADGKLAVELAEGEDAEPSKALVTKARRAAKSLAGELGGEVHVELHGHETTAGRGFRPGHVTVTVSRANPKA